MKVFFRIGSVAQKSKDDILRVDLISTQLSENDIEFIRKSFIRKRGGEDFSSLDFKRKKRAKVFFVEDIERRSMAWVIFRSQCFISGIFPRFLTKFVLDLVGHFEISVTTFIQKSIFRVLFCVIFVGLGLVCHCRYLQW